MTTLQALLPDQSGWVDQGATGSTGIQGRWYAFADGMGSDGSPTSGLCELAGHPVSDCSQVATPQYGSFPNAFGKMCTSGIAARIVPAPDSGTALDFNNIRGAGIAFDFNDADMMMPPKATPYDALADRIRGIAFQIDAIPLSGLRVEFPTAATANDPAFWGGMDMISPVFPDENLVLWPHVDGPYYVVPAPAFDPTTLLGIRFHVLPNATSATPYNFCVSNLAAIF
jgi:hypothetical protein